MQASFDGSTHALQAAVAPGNLMRVRPAYTLSALLCPYRRQDDVRRKSALRKMPCYWTPRTCSCAHACADHICTFVPLQAAGRRVARVCAAKAARAHGRHGHACLRRGPWLCADLRTAHHAGVLNQHKLIESVGLVRLIGSWTSQTFFCAKRTLALCRPVYVPPIMQVC